MNNRPRMTRIRLALAASMLCSLLTSGPLPAADLALPQPEAPTEIFSAKIGDADVNLTILGSWTAAVSFGKSLLFAPNLPVQLQDSFPSLDLGFIPLNTPDVTISLRMMQKYFLEVSALGSFADNSILFGYDGEPGEVLQRLAVGTKGIELEPSAFLQVPTQAAKEAGGSVPAAAPAKAAAVAPEPAAAADPPPPRKSKKAKRRAERDAAAAAAAAAPGTPPTAKPPAPAPKPTAAAATPAPPPTRKRVQWALKANLAHAVGGPVPPAAVRTPPAARPRGPALKKRKTKGGGGRKA